MTAPTVVVNLDLQEAWRFSCRTARYLNMVEQGDSAAVHGGQITDLGLVRAMAGLRTTHAPPSFTGSRIGTPFANP